jgi:sterol 3beta-glucosyltransferase
VRVTALAVGSRGDVEPFLALGAGLTRAGHRVRLATHAAFEGLVEGAGLEFAELPGDPQAALSSPAGQAMLATRNPAALPGRMRRLIGPGLAESAVPAERACADADVVIASSLAMLGTTAAEVAGARLVFAHFQPATPTGAFAAASAPVARDLPGPLNLLPWSVAERVLWRAVRPVLAQRRRELGLPPLPAAPPSRWSRPRRAPTLNAYSAAVAPVPPDWPAEVLRPHVGGRRPRPHTPRGARTHLLPCVRAPAGV